MNKINIPVYTPSLDGNESKYVEDCIKSSWISSKGKYVDLFESAFREFVGAKHAIGVPNGTIALHLALLGLGIGPGDEVIVPSLTYIASANAIKYVGATPVFADVEKDYWQVDPYEVEGLISDKTRAILCVHLYGHPSDMNALKSICDVNGLYLIEDCAEAIGSKYHGKHVGVFGDVATFSFYGNKTITTGEGGMVVCNEASLDKLIRKYRGQGLADNREYWHDIIGYNYRMTNIAAAIGLAQLERVDEILKKKIEVAEDYKKAVSDLPLKMHSQREALVHSYWMVNFLLDDPDARDGLREYLIQNGVETRPVFYPIHQMPPYYQERELPNTEMISKSGITLPSYPGLSKVDQDYVIQKIFEFYDS